MALAPTPTFAAALPSTRQRELAAHLNRLIAHERTAMDVCELAANRLDDLEQRVRVRGLVRRHFRRVDTLSRCVMSLGHQPSHDKAALPHLPAALRQARERGRVLKALLADEESIQRLYMETMGHVPSGSAELTSLLQTHLRHQDRDRAWLIEQLEGRAAA